MTTPIVFFNGWGMDAHAVAHLNDGRDVVMVAPQQAGIALPVAWRGQTVHVVAWSMGVWAANRWLATQQTVQIGKSIAVNGTPLGIDDKQGIPKSTFTQTAAGFNEHSRRKLYRRIFARAGERSEDYAAFVPKLALTEQLAALHQLLAQADEPSGAYAWQYAWISRQDLVFAHDNQMAYWQSSDARVQVVDEPHHLMRRWSSWGALLADCT